MSLRPFLWPQRKSLTPEALYIVCSCHERYNKKMIYMSIAARAAAKATIRLRSNENNIQQPLWLYGEL